MPRQCRGLRALGRRSILKDLTRSTHATAPFALTQPNAISERPAPPGNGNPARSSEQKQGASTKRQAHHPCQRPKKTESTVSEAGVGRAGGATSMASRRESKGGEAGRDYAERCLNRRVQTAIVGAPPDRPAPDSRLKNHNDCRAMTVKKTRDLTRASRHATSAPRVTRVQQLFST